MMSIILNNGLELTWHIGKGIPVSYDHVNDVSEIQADGDELSRILEKFDNLPMAKNGRVVRYFGDHARFIVGNIR